jgi:hypothetical protein
VSDYGLTIPERLRMLAHVWGRELRRRWHRNRWRRRRIVRRLANRERPRPIAYAPTCEELKAAHLANNQPGAVLELEAAQRITAVTGSNRYSMGAPHRVYIPHDDTFLAGLGDGQQRRAEHQAAQQKLLEQHRSEFAHQRAAHVTALAQREAQRAGASWPRVEAEVAAHIVARGDITDVEVRAIAAECVVDDEDRVEYRG